MSYIPRYLASILYSTSLVRIKILMRKNSDLLRNIRKSDLCEFTYDFESLNSESIIHATTINHAMNI